MKILYILPYLPVPPNSGNKNLIFGLLKYINHNADFDVIMLSESTTEDSSQTTDLFKREFPNAGRVMVFAKPTGWKRRFQRIRYLLQGLHPALGNYVNSELWNWVHRATNDQTYDLVHFDMFHTVIYQDAVKFTPCILIASDAYSMAAATARIYNHKFKELLSNLIQEKLLKRMEIKYYPRFDAVCSVSPKDAEYLSRLTGMPIIHNVGIAVSDDYVKRPITHFISEKSKDRKVKLLLTGSLSHAVVADGVIGFIEKTLPVLRRQYAYLEVTILGKGATPELKTCIARQIGVDYLDFVDDYAAFLEQDWIYVYPQRCGSGLQTKLQQAMALGLPVVGYEISFGGLKVINGEHAFICKDEEQLARSVLHLLSSRDARIKMGKAAAYHTREFFSINNVGKKTMDIYKGLFGSKSRSQNISNSNEISSARLKS